VSTGLLDMCTASGGGPLGQLSLVLLSFACMSSPLAVCTAGCLAWLLQNSLASAEYHTGHVPFQTGHCSSPQLLGVSGA